MPKKKIISVFFLGGIVLGCLCVPYFYREKVTPSHKVEARPFYVAIPIAQFTPGGLPCVDAEVEGKKFLALLDLGYTRYVSARHEIVSAVSKKSFLKTSPAWGSSGNQYLNNVYKIPSLNIGNLTLSSLLLEEENEAMQKEATISKSQQLSDPLHEGKLGWRMFKNMVLFLDLDNDTITVCDSLETFKRQGPSLDAFVKVPFFLDRELIEFDIGTPKGPLRSFLDTGCTANHLHMSNPKNLPLEELLFDENKVVRFSQVQIGRHKFGSIAFRPLPLNLPIRAQAILGMDFLFDTQVLIDFNHRNIYFRQNREES